MNIECLLMIIAQLALAAVCIMQPYFLKRKKIWTPRDNWLAILGVFPALISAVLWSAILNKSSVPLGTVNAYVAAYGTPVMIALMCTVITVIILMHFNILYWKEYRTR